MTATQQTIKFQHADFSTMTFSDKKKSPTQGRPENVWINIGSRGFTFYQLNNLRVPFEPEKSEDGSITFSVNLDKSNPKHLEYINKLKEFDALITQELKNNRFGWVPGFLPNC
jgi:hypothetical protein